jgi:hypothetical protein
MTRQPGSTPRTDDCVVRPLRFTDDVAAMRDFLGLLGLAPRVESQRGGWVDLVAGAGMVALHDAAGSATGGRPGQTNLSFESADLDALAARLSDAGWDDATIWDEAYGRVLSVTDPAGERLWVDGYNDDDYGYDVHRPERDGRWSVMPVRSTSVVPEYVRFLGCFGLEPYADRPARSSAATSAWSGSTPGRRRSYSASPRRSRWRRLPSDCGWPATTPPSPTRT